MSNDHLTVETTAAGGEFMLFGVRVVVDSMRKSVSLNNLSQYQHHLDSPPDVDLATGNVAGGYASADEAAHRSSAVTATASAINRERKRGVPWTEEEHKLFLLGLQKVGKGDWRGISRTFVKTRTPTQVASHAQKYFLRRSNLNRRRRRSSLFDITTADSVAANSSNDQIMSTENKIRRVENQPQQSKFEISNVQFTISPTPICNDQLTAGSAARAVESPGSSSSNSKSMFDFNLNTNTNTDTNTSAMSFDSSPLSLNLSLSMFPQRFDSRDGVISVA